MECQRCGCQEFFVLETRRLVDGSIRRRRACRNCGRRVTTRETVDRNLNRAKPPS